MYPDGTYLEIKYKRHNKNSAGFVLDNLSDKILLLDHRAQKRFTTSGIYSVEGDTITVETCSKLVFHRWDLYRLKFLVESKDTIKLIQFVSFDGDFNDKYIHTRNETYHFVPCDSLPSSFEALLKKEKWMWDNKKDWKVYKDSFKQYDKHSMPRCGIEKFYFDPD